VRLSAIKFLFRHVSNLTLSVRMVVGFGISSNPSWKSKAHNRT
jgi:tryptophan synthase alpha subunit